MPRIWWYKLSIVVVLILAYWPILAGDAIMKWDILDINLPWKYFVVECLRNGELPWWNPYNNYGFVQAGDPGSWYIISWIFGLPFHYTLQVMQFEHLFHLLLAGFGMFAFMRYIKVRDEIAFAACISYMLSGFFVGNAQHVGWTVAAAWLPWIVLTFKRILETYKLKDALLLAVFMFLLLTGGYPGLFISICYGLLFWFFGHKLIKLRKGEIVQLWKIGGQLAIAAIAFFCLSAEVLNASFHLSDVVNRAKGLSFDPTIWGFYSGALPPKALLTFLFGFLASTPEDSFWTENFTVVNCYIGFFSLILVGVGFRFNKLKSSYTLLFLFALGMLVIAMAKVFPVRYWLIVLPYMKLFRFASVFRLFALFILIVLAGLSLEKLVLKNNLKVLLGPFLSAVIVLIAGCVYLALFSDVFHFKTLWQHGFEAYALKTGPLEKVYFQSLILIVFSIVLVLAVSYFNTKKALWVLVIVMCSDVFLAQWMNGSATIYQNVKLNRVEEFFANSPLGFPKPPMHTAVQELSDSAFNESGFPLIVNLGAFYKLPFSSGVSPYALEVYEEALFTTSFINYQSKPFAFLANHFSKDSLKLKNQLRFIEFGPNKFQIYVDANEVDTLIIQQIYQQEWQCSVDGESIAPFAVNKMFLGVKVEKGEHRIEFEYALPRGKQSVNLSLLVLALILFFLVLVAFKKSKVNGLIFALICCAIFVEFMLFWGIDSLALKTKNVTKHRDEVAYSMILSDEVIDNKFFSSANAVFEAPNNRLQLNKMLDLITKSGDNEFNLYCENRFFNSAIVPVLRHYFKVVEVEKNMNLIKVFCKHKKDKSNFNVSLKGIEIVGKDEFQEINSNDSIVGGVILNSNSPFGPGVDMVINNPKELENSYLIATVAVSSNLKSTGRIVLEYEHNNGKKDWEELVFSVSSDSTNWRQEILVKSFSQFNPEAGDKLKLFTWNLGTKEIKVGKILVGVEN